MTPPDLPGQRGDFEVHLTVGPGTAEALAADAAERFAARRAVG
ncbi:hypothetical protein ACIQ9P_12900 [Kitasatospora sp. NPDC094019]